jgi:opacity protein-like surface antigen
MNPLKSLLLVCVPAFLIGALANPAAALDLGGHDRDGVVVGLTLGHGWNGVNFETTDGRGAEDDISAFTGAFKVGWARSDQLVGFIGLSGWKRSYVQNITPATATNFNFLAELYWYPRGGGFWIKGGLGTGYLDLYVNTALPADRIEFREGGLTTTVGAGYEFRATGTTAFGIAYDYTHVDMGDFGEIRNASTGNHVLAFSFTWYQD